MTEWGSYPLEQSVWQSFELGQFTWWVQYAGGVWSHVAQAVDNSGTPAEAGPSAAAGADPATETGSVGVQTPTSDAYIRHVAPSSIQPVQIHLVPRCPDRPMLAKTKAPISFPPGSIVDLFMPVPLWWSARTSDGDELYQASIEPLSQSWFGDSMRGTLCYSLFTDPSHEAVSLCDTPPRAACTLRVKNQSGAVYTSDRFLIPADQLSVFSWHDRPCAIAASSILTVISSADDVQVTVAAGPPAGVLFLDHDEHPAYGAGKRSELQPKQKSRTGKRGGDGKWTMLTEPRVAPVEAWWKRGVNLLQRISNY